MQAIDMQVTGEANNNIYTASWVTRHAATHCMLQLELIHDAVFKYIEGLEQSASLGDPASDSPTALLGRAFIQRALAVSGMPDDTRQQNAKEACQKMRHANTQAVSPTERLLLEQVSR